MKIDNKWLLEGFLEQKGASAGLYAGFVGVGQGGGKMVDALASIKNLNGTQAYPCIVANSNLGDMQNLKNIPSQYKFGMKGYENGVGKDPELGRTAFLENGEKIFDAIGSLMSKCQVIVVVVSLGGGTGTGAVNDLVAAIREYLGIPVIVIASLPRPNEVESRNAYNALAELTEKFTVNQYEDGEYRLLESLIILDNEKIFNEHIQDPEMPKLGLTWDYYSNYKLASIWHEWSVLTTLGSDYTVDVADLLNHILLGGGVITFAKKKINLDEVTTTEDRIKEIVSTYRGRNVLANGFDYENDMRSLALVVVMPKARENELNQDTLEMIRSEVKAQLPNVNFYPGSVTNNSDRHAIVYTMANMGGLPERARNLRHEAEELLQQRLASERAASGFQMGDKLDAGAKKNPFAGGGVKKGNPFAAKKEASAGQEDATVPKTQTKNPFNKFSNKFN
ncbi:tubulin-like doman-containing protein [Paenibacillus hubeiensis]|uniref:tubulin-like doman-containing protein n=1 Tax=Paenibacillus hubeiensis TaxID=3077330 RepID=UPI0031B9E14E